MKEVIKTWKEEFRMKWNKKTFDKYFQYKINMFGDKLNLKKTSYESFEKFFTIKVKREKRLEIEKTLNLLIGKLVC